LIPWQTCSTELDLNFSGNVIKHHQQNSTDGLCAAPTATAESEKWRHGK